MQRTIDVIVHADGTIELLEPVVVSGARRALRTILEDGPARVTTPADNDASINALLLRAGREELPDEIPDDLEPRSEEALDVLWARIPAGTPLSQIVIEDREETF